jgi:hypothetical protein
MHWCGGEQEQTWSLVGSLYYLLLDCGITIGCVKDAVGLIYYEQIAFSGRNVRYGFVPRNEYPGAVFG